jgi:hypothetical protein
LWLQAWPRPRPGTRAPPVSIRTDDAGRFNLNDLHKASGGERRHDTREFTSRSSTRELVEALQAEMTEKPVNSVPGRNGGTWVVKELVYAYAMWISPKFHIQVIRAYDSMVTAPRKVEA